MIEPSNSGTDRGKGRGIEMTELLALSNTRDCTGFRGPGTTPASSPAVAPSSCPVCRAPIGGRFCEECGHDSALPAPDLDAPTPPVSQPVSAWTVLVAADREFYERVLAGGGPDTVEFPEPYPERRITLRRATNLIGRRNRDQGVEPEIDLAIHPADRGVSTQHAVLRIRDSGLTITDLGSTNGTSINAGTDFLRNGEEISLADGGRIHVGASTTITLRQGR